MAQIRHRLTANTIGAIVWGILFVLVCLPTHVFAQTPAKKPVSKSPGQLIYEQHCLSCHQADGSGVPNLNPPLRSTDWVVGDKTRLINVVLKGLQGHEIEGDVYDNAMPSHDFLTDAQIANVLTYLRSSFGNKAGSVTPDEVKAVRAQQ